MLRWTFLLVIPLFIFTGCGDLEPEMQDTRTVILNMDFDQRSSSRTSSVSAAELSQYNTHLILALPSWEYLTSSYKNFYSSFAQGLMNTADKKVSLEIPLNTQMKIFAFLFKENYSMSELFSGVREVGYYGESQTFSISTNTNSLSLGITLKAASGNEDDSTGGGGGGDQGGTDTTAPVIAEVYPVTTPTSDSTPDYTFSSTKDGTISYGGSCSSTTVTAYSGNNNIHFNTLTDGTYSDCTITVTDSAGNVSNTLTLTTFIVDSTAATLAEVTAVTTPTNDTTPDYTFSSSEAGTITYGGSCSSSTTSVTSGNNTITLVSLSTGTYSDCTITVTDAAGNVSSTLTLSSFTVAESEQMGGSMQGGQLSLSTAVTTVAGTGSSGSANGTGTSASFNRPTGITTDGTNLYVTDTYNYLIRKIVL